MQVTCALLCDAATIREGMLHVLGGGANRLGRPVFPAPMNVALALMTLQDRSEALDGHTLEVICIDEDGQAIYRSVTPIGIASFDDIPEGEQVAVPVVIPLQAIGLPRPGLYNLRVLVDSHEKAVLTFRVFNNSATAS